MRTNRGEEKNQAEGDESEFYGPIKALLIYSNVEV